MTGSHTSTGPCREEQESRHSAAAPEVDANAPNGEDKADVAAPRYVHPEAVKMFACCPWARHIPIFGEAVEGFGWQVVAALGGSYFFCKGIADQIFSNQTYAMMIDRYGIDTPRYQRLSPISTMGWSIKAFTAMLCDGFAFLGYTKRWYMFVSCVAGAVFALVYGLLPAKQSSADTACAFIFLSSWGKANVDILSEGHYSRLIRRNPTAGPALISWIWVWVMVGAIIAVCITGPLADKNVPQISIFVSCALQFITCFFYLFNMYGEKKNRVLRSEDALFMIEETRKERERLGLEPHPEELQDAEAEESAHQKKLQSEHSHSDQEAVQNAVQDALNDDLSSGEMVQADFGAEEEGEEEVYYGVPPVPCLFGVFEMNKEVIIENWRVFAYSGVMTCAVVAMLCANILCDTLGLLIVCVVVSTICCTGSFWALPTTIAKTNIFAYLQMVVFIHASSPLQTFYLNSNDCPGDMPNFTYTFYNTVGGIIGNIAGLLGVSAFNYIFSQHNYQMTYFWTTTMQVVAAVFDIIMVKRWNQAIGIPDHAMYIWGDSIVQQIVYMLGFMPLVILLSRLVPRGSESVVYALMAGFANLGQTTASSIAAIVMEYGWPVFAADDKCNFENLPWVIFTCTVMAPLLVIPLSFLLPMARIIDDIDIDGHVIRQIVDEKVIEHVVTEASEDESPPQEPFTKTQGIDGAAARADGSMDTP